jgi:hypothetical protein
VLRRTGAGLAGALALALVLTSPRPGRGDPPSESVAPAPSTSEDAVTAAGRAARGLYIGARFVQRNSVDDVVGAVQMARMNAVVLDLKDADGRVHHATTVPELAAARTGWLGDAAALNRRLGAEGIYRIARITCFADRWLPAQLPERAILHARRDEPWVSWGTGGTWLDPYNRENHRMVADLAREAEALGFDEIQLDYVRFPVDEGTRYARYPAERDTARAEVLVELLRTVDAAVSLPLGVDVFGLAAYREGDPSGLGQDLAAWQAHVDVYTPMLYPNAMRAWRLGEEDRSFRLVFGGVFRLRQRVGDAPVVRPFLQAFERGADDFGPDFITQQVRGARRGGADGFLFWHPGAAYSVVRAAFRGRARFLLPFPTRSRSP